MSSSVRWSQKDLDRIRGRVKKAADRTEAAILSARTRIRLPGFDPRMNKTEAAYALVLEARRIDGEIRSWKFEPFKLRLADRTYYSPDFLVEGVGSELEVHEVKGFWRDDARVKFKVAVREFPMFRFRVVRKLRKKQGGGWSIESAPWRS